MHIVIVAIVIIECNRQCIKCTLMQSDALFRLGMSFSVLKHFN